MTGVHFILQMLPLVLLVLVAYSHPFAVLFYKFLDWINGFDEDGRKVI